MTVTVTVQRTTGVTHSGQYNTVGGQIAQSVTGAATPIVYTWTLNSGQQLGASSMRTFRGADRRQWHHAPGDG